MASSKDLLKRYWGEIPTDKTKDTGKNAVDKAEIVKLRPIKTQKAKLAVQKSDTKKPYAKIDNIPSADPIQHLYKLSNILKMLKDGVSPSSLDPSLLKIQEPLPRQLKFNQMNNLSSIRQLLKKSIILILAHGRFEKTNESILELLIDITSNYLEKISTCLSVEMDTKKFKSENDFVDLIQRTFAQFELTTLDLQSFYDGMSINRDNLVKDISHILNTSEMDASITTSPPNSGNPHQMEQTDDANLQQLELLESVNITDLLEYGL